MSHMGWVMITSIMMLFGLAGVVIPALPGIPLMFAIALVFGWADGFRHLTGVELLVLLVLTLAAVGVDYLSGLLGARYGGASVRSMVMGMLGFVAGTLLLPPFGGIIGMFLTVILTEILQNKGHRQALRAATGSVIGTLAGMAISLVIGILFLVSFLFFAWR